MSRKGVCQLCGQRKRLSKEHLPPKCAGNLGRLRIAFIDSKAAGSQARVREKTTQNGFWVPRLCDSCNNKTGARYGEAYGEFVAQFSSSAQLSANAHQVYVALNGIFPSRVLKQAFTMFLAAVPWEPHPKWQQLRDYVLDKDAPLPNDAPDVFVYLNSSTIGRVVPACGVVELATHKILCVSEISWPPVGVVFSYQRDARFDAMAEITNWGTREFGDQIDCTLQVPRLDVISHNPLAFGTPDEVAEYERRKLPVYLYHVPGNRRSLTDISVLATKS